jgi:hypothetical protein
MRRWHGRLSSETVSSAIFRFQDMGLLAGSVAAGILTAAAAPTSAQTGGPPPTAEVVVTTGHSQLGTPPLAPSPPAAGDAQSVAPEAFAANSPGNHRDGGQAALQPRTYVQGIVAPGSSASPSDAVFTSLTPGPPGRASSTVFASGALVNNCWRPTGCPVLFTSTDGARSWTHLRASGFAGGAILLPQTFPTDPVIFASGPQGLQRSDNGGQSFLPALPATGPAAVDPASPAGDAAVLVGSVPLLVYHAGARTVDAGPVLPMGVTAVDDVAFSRDGTRMFVAVRENVPSDPGRVRGSVLSCDPATSCVELAGATFTSDDLPLHLVPVPGGGGSTSVFIVSAHSIVAADESAVLRTVQSWHAESVVAVSVAPDYAASQELLVETLGGSGGLRGLQRSDDGGASFVPLQGIGLASTAVLAQPTVLRDGRILAGLVSTQSDEIGLRCSRDRGVTWQENC